MPSNEDVVVFAPAWLKVQRAHQHVQEVEARFAAYGDSNFWRVYPERSAEGTALVAEVTKTPPLEISVAVGDAIHNLRAALDYLTSHIGADTRGLDKRVKFPIDETREALVKSFSAGITEPCRACGRGAKGRGSNYLIQEMAPDVADLIINQIKPYGTGDAADERGRAIWAMNKFDNINKHRIVQIVANIAAIGGVYAKSENIYIQNHYVVLSGNRSTSFVAANEEITIENPGYAIAHIKFPKGSYFDGQHVIQTLYSLMEYTATVIHTFDMHFHERK